MNEALPDAKPVTQRFLVSLSQFLEHQHGGPSQGDISQDVKQAIAQQTQAPEAEEEATGKDIAQPET